MCDCKCCDEKVNTKTFNEELNMIHDSFLNDIQELKVKYLGKEGYITVMLKALGKVSPEDRVRLGNKINQITHNINTYFESDIKQYHIE